MSVTVIIPAHNEESVILRCLRALLTGSAPGELDVLVVCNGCTDRTADVARSADPCVRVIETPVPSKTEALNLGDAAATYPTRIYLDADVELTIDAAREIVSALHGGGYLAAAPSIDVKCAESTWAVRAFYSIWCRLPYLREGMVGSGVYGLSPQARARFDRFPPITADDAFARLHFRHHERITVQSHSYTVRAPRDLKSLIKVKSRSHWGNVELRRGWPHLIAHENARHGGALASLACRPALWPALAVYAYVKIATRLRVTFRYGVSKPRWERDDTSRVAAAIR